MKVALAGNPNCGKTTLFNLLTGSNQSVGNWPGVTVEKKSGYYRKNKEIEIIDLPGIYSLSPYSLDEVVARNFLLEESLDLIINLVDASNLERNLYLTTQLIETGIPVIIALNMMDLVRSHKDNIDKKKLEQAFGCPVYEICGLKNEGIDELMANLHPLPMVRFNFDWYQGKVKSTLEQYRELLSKNISNHQLCWYAIKLFEEDEQVLQKNDVSSYDMKQLDALRQEIVEEEDDDAESIITDQRYQFITNVMKIAYQKNRKGISTSDKIDQIVTNRWLALPIFALVMIFIYYVSVSTVGQFVTDWMNEGVFGEGWNLFGVEAWFIPSIPDMFGSILESMQVAPWLVSLILDGIVAGVGAVLGFVPQMFVLFFFLAVLEDIGYMARIAFILDRIFRKFGLSGKSFIPMLIGTGCGVPGIMASRTIENEKDRRLSIMITTFIPCSAKLPIIALIANALFQGAWWVSPVAYFIGIGAILISGILLKKTKLFAGDVSAFVMELPNYHIPKAVNVFRSMWERGWSFICKASTVILLASVVIWFFSRMGFVEGHFQFLEAEELHFSLLAGIGNVIAPIFQPLGWGSWQASVAAITGLVAKETVVSTLGILYGFAELSENANEIWGPFSEAFNQASAFSFLVFNLLCAPCFAAIGAMKREMNHKKWTWFALIYQCVFAYIVAFVIYQLWIAISYQVFSFGGLLSIVVLIASIYFIFMKKRKSS